MLYFQANTNTYGNVMELKKKYDTIRGYNDFVALSIGTRPDCVDPGILDMIEAYARDYEVWIEYGLQTANDGTLKKMNRGHDAETFVKAVRLTRQRKGIKVAAHVIVGLPGESSGDVINTAGVLSELRVDGVKAHPLHVVKGTELEKRFSGGGFKPLEEDEYVRLAADFIEYIWSGAVLMRLTADCPLEYLAGPGWISDKQRTLGKIDAELERRGSRQGCRSPV
jgi:radical SAM protein (TIGR01212 family)